MIGRIKRALRRLLHVEPSALHGIWVYTPDTDEPDPTPPARPDCGRPHPNEFFNCPRCELLERVAKARQEVADMTKRIDGGDDR